MAIYTFKNLASGEVVRSRMSVPQYEDLVALMDDHLVFVHPSTGEAMQRVLDPAHFVLPSGSLRAGRIQ